MSVKEIPLQFAIKGDDMAKDLNIGVLLDFYGSLLHERQRQVVDYYYNEDYSLAEIAELVGMTRQGVRDSIKRGEAILCETEEKLHFEQRFRQVSRQIEQIQQAAEAIEHISQQLGNEELGRQVEKLRSAAQDIQSAGPEVLGGS